MDQCAPHSRHYRGQHWGFDAFYFARIDYQDRIERRKNGKMEMLWRASPSLKNEIFSGAFVQGAYCSPPVFGWGGAFDGEPIMNNQMFIL